jgi:hypothetical protein
MCVCVRVVSASSTWASMCACARVYVSCRPCQTDSLYGEVLTLLYGGIVLVYHSIYLSMCMSVCLCVGGDPVVPCARRAARLAQLFNLD